MNGAIESSSFTGHGMPCPYCGRTKNDVARRASIRRATCADALAQAGSLCYCPAPGNRIARRRVYFMCISAHVAPRIAQRTRRAPQHHMSQRFSDSPSGRVRHWERRRSRSSAPWFVRPLVILVAFALIVVLAFRGVQYALHSRHASARANVTVYEDSTSAGHSLSNPATGMIPGWQRDVIVALDEAQRHASEGDATETNVAVDRAASIVIVARLRSQPTPPDFFDDALAKLDRFSPPITPTRGSPRTSPTRASSSPNCARRSSPSRPALRRRST